MLKRYHCRGNNSPFAPKRGNVPIVVSAPAGLDSLDAGFGVEFEQRVIVASP